MMMVLRVMWNREVTGLTVLWHGFANGHIPYMSQERIPSVMEPTGLFNVLWASPPIGQSGHPVLPKADGIMCMFLIAAYSNRSPQAHYRIYHAGGETDYYLDQRMRRFTWIHIGTYFFEAGGTNR